MKAHRCTAARTGRLLGAKCSSRAAWLVAALTWPAAFTAATAGAQAAQSGAQAGSHPATHGAAPATAVDRDTASRLAPTVFGAYSRRITTTTPAAQEAFDRGMQLMYVFTPRDAAKEFRVALREDPTCAMCAWGEAWSLGAYLNEPMPPANAPLAYAAAARADSLAREAATPTERALIAAMRTRYTPTHDSSTRRSLDTAYTKAMREVAKSHPDDLDVATLYAEALMLLEPRRGMNDTARVSMRQLLGVLESVLARDIRHPGACHLYVHATEATQDPGRAEACAEHLGVSVPGASHMNHMPSHTFNRVGRWGDAVRANIMAWHSDQRASWGDGVAIYPSHNLHMLLFAASYDGQGAIAIQAGRDYGKLVPGGSFYHALTLVRFGRFDEVLALSEAPNNVLYRGLWLFSRGYAHLRTGMVDSALANLAQVDEIARTRGEETFRQHTARHLLGITGNILRGEIARQAGDTARALRAFELAVTFEDSLGYDEPEPLPLSARHWLGAAYLESGRGADAEAVYRRELEDHPNNGWSLFGLSQALSMQGDRHEADAIRDTFNAAWERSDTLLRSSRF